MTTFDQKFIEDPRFVEWVFRPAPAINQYWEKYIQLHPEEKNELLELKQRMGELKFSNDALSREEKSELAHLVVKRIDRDQNQNKIRTMLRPLLKYAAVAIIFATIGGLAVYLNVDKESVYHQLAGQIIEIPSSNQGPLLITSSGENVNLRKSNSSVDYSKTGAIVLNNDSVIRAASDVPSVMNQLVIPYGNQSRVVLSDNSVVWLNSGSRLVYPTLFQGKTREVLLFGEAFFEVSKNEDKPFVVKTSDIEIKVLGTQFNVSAYAEDKLIQTVLKEGSVEIRKNNSRLFDSRIVLKPNQMASFSKISNETKLYDVDVNYYTLWTRGLLSFDDMDFNRVLKKVERFYNISIDFSEPILASIHISGKLDLKQKREEVLEYLEKVSLTRIEKTDENKYIVNK